MINKNTKYPQKMFNDVRSQKEQVLRSGDPQWQISTYSNDKNDHRTHDCVCDTLYDVE